MSEPAALKAQIERAFAHGEYPGGWCLIDSREGCEPGLLEQEFKGKTAWRTLEASFIVFALTHGLDDKSRGERINPRRYGERTWFEHARHKFAVFNAAQARAIVGYLRHKLTNAEISDFEKTRIRQALDNYWLARVTKTHETKDHPSDARRRRSRARGALLSGRPRLRD